MILNHMAMVCPIPIYAYLGLHIFEDANVDLLNNRCKRFSSSLGFLLQIIKKFSISFLRSSASPHHDFPQNPGVRLHPSDFKD